MRGPTDKSNWVIAGRVLQGAYPIGKTEIEQRQVISALMRVGVGCFVVREPSNGVNAESEVVSVSSPEGF